jgi:hypothetical protein
MSSLKKGGRPAKLDDAITAKLVEGIELGLSYAAACRSAGVARSTFASWKRKGDDAQAGIYRRFSDQVKTAEAVALDLLSDALMKSALGGYEVTERRQTFRDGKLIEEQLVTKQATPNGLLILQMLSRRLPATWGRRQLLLEPSPDLPLTVALFGNVGFGTGDLPPDLITDDD